MIDANPYLRKVRSFVRRDSRITDSQLKAMNELWPQYGLNLSDSVLNYSQHFKVHDKNLSHLPVFLEIGFGSGQSLFELAKLTPERNYIGVETHKPGIGSLLLNLSREPLNNLKVFYADANDVLMTCIADHSLTGIQIFFPDPWPKRKHHKRRLIQDDFVALLATKLKVDGIIHLATDWEHYAHHMMQVLSNSAMLQNIAGVGRYSSRSEARPILTKFENTGVKLGRKIWELQFKRI